MTSSAFTDGTIDDIFPFIFIEDEILHAHKSQIVCVTCPAALLQAPGTISYIFIASWKWFSSLSVWLCDQWELWTPVTIGKRKHALNTLLITQKLESVRRRRLSSSLPLSTSLFTALHLNFMVLCFNNSTDAGTLEWQQLLAGCHHIRASMYCKMAKWINTNNLATAQSLVLYAFSLAWRGAKQSSQHASINISMPLNHVYATHSPQFVPMHCLLRLVVVVLRFVFQHIGFSRSGKKSVLIL